ncbi:MAG: TPR end-of-group domain-containing protein [Planctomycetota bacterium]|jgi:tetratricopeptide (TPR) repeat protein
MDMESIRRIYGDSLARADFRRANTLLDRLDFKTLSYEERLEVRRMKSALRTAAFLHHNPLELRVLSSQEVYTFGQGVPLHFEIFNLADQALSIPGQSGLSWLPWAEKRRTCFLWTFQVTDISKQDGSLCSGKWDQMQEFEETWHLDSGHSRAMELFLELNVPQNGIYRRLEVGAELIPGGLQNGALDWGMIRLQAAPQVIHFLPEEDLSVMEDPKGALRRALEARDGKQVIQAALLCEDTDQEIVLGEIFGWLPEFRLSDQTLILSALRLITGLDLGYDVDRWLDWWDLQRRDPGGTATKASRAENGLLETPSGPCTPYSFLEGLIALISAGVLWADVGENPEFGGTSHDPDLDTLRQGLMDPYYCRRYAAQKRLAALGVEKIGIMEELIADSSPEIRIAAATALGQLKGARVGKILEEALLNEKEAWVRQRLAQVLALGAPLPEKSRALARLSRDPLLEDLYFETLFMVRLEDLMHFNSMPGFYDGQFDAIWQIPGDVYSRLLRIALDPDHAFLIRVLAIMALHEKKDPMLIIALKPLILDPVYENDLKFDEVLDFDIDEDFILANRRRNLSKYARFSLAKAGYPQFNLAKIEVMKKWLQKHRDKVFGDSPYRISGLGLDLDPFRNFGKNLLLDIGYNYQQYDQFDDAERWYKVLIERFSKDEDYRYISEAHYNLGCLYSVTGRKEKAIEEVRLAIEKGFLDLSWMERDKDLDNIRDEPDYQMLRDLIINRSPDEEKP